MRENTYFRGRKARAGRSRAACVCDCQAQPDICYALLHKAKFPAALIITSFLGRIIQWSQGPRSCASSSLRSPSLSSRSRPSFRPSLRRSPFRASWASPASISARGWARATATSRPSPRSRPHWARPTPASWCPTRPGRKATTWKSSPPLGWRPKAAGFAFDLGVLNRDLPGSRAGVDADYWEYQADAARKLGPVATRLRINYSPDGFAATRAAWWLELQGAVAVSTATKVSAAVANRMADGGVDYKRLERGRQAPPDRRARP